MRVPRRALRALLLALVACALALPAAASASTVLAAPGGVARGTTLLPPAPAAGQLPPAGTCDDPAFAGTDYCQLTAFCADLTDAPAAEAHACDVLKEREQLRTCRASEHSSDPCTAQTLRVQTQCMEPDADAALCTEFETLRSGEPYGSNPGSGSGAGAGTGSGPDSDVAERNKLCEQLEAQTPTPGEPAVRCPTLGDGDVLGMNGGGSPWCDRADLSALSKEVCRSSRGAVSRPHPLSSYGLDWWIGIKTLHPIETGLQIFATVVWKILLWLFNSALLLLDWAFSMDLTSQAMRDIETSVLFLHDIVLGPSWMLAGIAILGLWALWNGLVRQQTIQTLSGLAMSVMMMIVALIIIHDPRGTVGMVSKWTNDSSVAALSLSSVGTVRDPGQSFASAQQQLFTSAVTRPWCVMQFGDAQYCDRAWKGPLPGSPYDKLKLLDGPFAQFKVIKPATWLADRLRDRQDARLCGTPATLADAWLCFPANSSRREALYNDLKNEDGRRVVLQEATGVTDRIGLLLLVGGGLLGAAALFGSIGGHLVFAGISTLVYLLLAPLMLILAAFGERGREMFTTYLKRLFGSVLSKFIYAIIFGAAVLVSNIITGLDGLGFYPQWLLLMIFWWGLFSRRRDIISAASLGDRTEAGTGLMRAASAYLGYRAARDVAGDAYRVARAPVRGAQRVRARLGRELQSHHEAVAEDANRQLDDAARQRVADRHRREHGRAHDYDEAGRDRDAHERERDGVRQERRKSERELERLTQEQERLHEATQRAGGPPLDASKARDADRFHEAGQEQEELERRLAHNEKTQAAINSERDRLARRQAAMEAKHGPVVPLSADQAAAVERYHDAGAELAPVQQEHDALGQQLAARRHERDGLVAAQQRAEAAGATGSGAYGQRAVHLASLDRDIDDLEQRHDETGLQAATLSAERDDIAHDLGGAVPDRAAVGRGRRAFDDAQRISEADGMLASLQTEREQMDVDLATAASERDDIAQELGGTPDRGWAARARRLGDNEDRAAEVQSAITTADERDRELSSAISDRDAERAVLEQELGSPTAARSWSNRVLSRERDADGNALISEREVADERGRLERELESSDDPEREALRRAVEHSRGAEYVTADSGEAARGEIARDGNAERTSAYTRDMEAARREEQRRWVQRRRR